MKTSSLLAFSSSPALIWPASRKSSFTRTADLTNQCLCSTVERTNDTFDTDRVASLQFKSVLAVLAPHRHHQTLTNNPDYRPTCLYGFSDEEATWTRYWLVPSEFITHYSSEPAMPSRSKTNKKQGEKSASGELCPSPTKTLICVRLFSVSIFRLTLPSSAVKIKTIWPKNSHV